MKHRLALEVLPLSKATFEIPDHLNFTEQPIRYPRPQPHVYGVLQGDPSAARSYELWGCFHSDL